MSEVTGQYSRAQYENVHMADALEGKKHQHSFFTDVNGKNACFEGFDFSYCIFTRAYFHNASFSNCAFYGTHFIDCNFRNAKFRNCKLDYSTFRETKIPTSELLNNLPSWPNVRRELLQNLRRNAAMLGDYQSEKIFVIKEIDAKKEHYRRAWKQDEQYYREKYGTPLKRIAAGLKFLGLKLDNFAWGHGERLWMTLISLLVLLCALSLIVTVVGIPDIDSAQLGSLVAFFLKVLVHHINLFLGVSDNSGIKGILFIDWIIVVARFLIIGVIVAALYRRLSHR